MDPRAQMLGQLAPKVTQEIELMESQLNNILELHGTLQETVNERHNILFNLDDELIKEFDDFQQATETLHKTVEHELAELVKLADSVEESLDEHSKEFATAMKEVVAETMKKVQERIEESKHEKKNAWDLWQEQFRTFQNTMQLGHTNVHSMFGATQESIGQMRAKALESSRKAREKVEELGKQIEQVHNENEEKISESKRKFEEFQIEFKEKLEAAQENHLLQPAQELIGSVEEKVGQVFKQRITDSTDHVHTWLERMTEHVDSARDETSASRQAIEPHVVQIKELVDPLHTALEAAKEAVGKVGLSFT